MTPTSAPVEAPRGFLISPHAIPAWRLAAAVGATLAAAALFYVGFAHKKAAPFEAALFVLTAFLMPFDRVDAQVAVRAGLWSAMGIGLLVPSVSLSVAVVLCAGLALLVLGRAGLDGTHGAFRPTALRGPLVVSMIVGLLATHVLALFAIENANGCDAMLEGASAHVAVHVAMFASPVLIALGVLGLSRTRTWGLLLYGASLGAACLVVAVLLGASAHDLSHFRRFGEMGAIAYAFVPVVAALALVPVGGALIRKRDGATTPAPPRPRLYAGLVLCTALVAAALRLSLG